MHASGSAAHQLPATISSTPAVPGPCWLHRCNVHSLCKAFLVKDASRACCQPLRSGNQRLFSGTQQLLTTCHASHSHQTVSASPASSASSSVLQATATSHHHSEQQPPAGTELSTADLMAGRRQAIRRPVALASISVGDVPRAPMPGRDEEVEGTAWWASHQLVVQLLTSSFWAACLMAGAFYWAGWAVRNAASKKQQAAAAAAAGKAGVTALGPAGPAVDQAGTGLSGGLLPGDPSVGKAVVDDLSDPWAPIRFIMQRTFGGFGQAPDESRDSSPEPSTAPGSNPQASAPVAETLATTTSPTGPSSSSSSSSGTSTSGTGTVQPLPEGWWRDLSKVHYINFGAKLGILPRLPQHEPTTPAPGQPYRAPAFRTLLVAFADKVDAEYVASSLRAGMQLASAPAAAVQELEAAVGGQSHVALLAARPGPTIRPTVVAAAPSQLEEMALPQRAGLAVVPQGVLQAYYGSQLSEAQLLTLLQDITAGRTPSVLPEQAARPRPAAISHVTADTARVATAAALGAPGSSSTTAVMATVPPLPSSQQPVHQSSSTNNSTMTATVPVDLTLGSTQVQPADHLFDFAEFEGPRVEEVTEAGNAVGKAASSRLPLERAPRPLMAVGVPRRAAAYRDGNGLGGDMAAHIAAGSGMAAARVQQDQVYDVVAGGQAGRRLEQATAVVIEPVGVQQPYSGRTVQGADFVTRFGEGQEPRQQQQQGTGQPGHQQQPGSSRQAEASQRLAGSQQQQQQQSGGSQLLSSTQPPSSESKQRTAGAVQEPVAPQASGKQPGMTDDGRQQPEVAGGGQPPLRPKDALMAEYEAFKKMFTAAREQPAADPPEPSAATGSATGAAASATATATQRIEAVLSRQGPTDQALEQALSMIAMPLRESSESDLDQWYAMQEALQGVGSDEKPLSSSMAAGSDPSAGSTAAPPTLNTRATASKPHSSVDEGGADQKKGVRAAFAAAAAKAQQRGAAVGQGQGSDKAKSTSIPAEQQRPGVEAPVPDTPGVTLASMQSQLDSMQLQLQQLLASSSSTGSSPPAGAVAELQSGMQALSVAMASATTGQAPSSAPAEPMARHSEPPPPPQPPAGQNQTTSSGSEEAAQPSSGARKGWGTGWGKRAPAGKANTGSNSSQRSVSQGAVRPAAQPSAPAAAAPGGTVAQLAVASSPADGPRVTEDGAVIVSKRAGRERPWKKTRDPAERQATVKEALRFVSAGLSPDATTDPIEQYDDEGRRLPPPDPSIDRVSGIDWDKVQRSTAAPVLDPTPASRQASVFGGSGGRQAEAERKLDTGKEKWWQRRFQAVFVPNVLYSDEEGVGYLQLDCSLVDGKRDMRVVMFEDRHDCMHCLKVMKQWPEYEWYELEMGMLPTHAVEQEIVRAWQAQSETGGATRPAGVVVFRRGKLPMRVGMSQAEFTQLVVYQAAAQLSLSKVGYEFDDF